jgi:hypothetical protein
VDPAFSSSLAKKASVGVSIPPPDLGLNFLSLAAIREGRLDYSIEQTVKEGVKLKQRILASGYMSHTTTIHFQQMLSLLRLTFLPIFPSAFQSCTVDVNKE